VLRLSPDLSSFLNFVSTIDLGFFEATFFFFVRRFFFSVQSKQSGDSVEIFCLFLLPVLFVAGYPSLLAFPGFGVFGVPFKMSLFPFSVPGFESGGFCGLSRSPEM